MEKKTGIIITIIILVLVLAGIGAYITLIPSYKTIEMSGYTLEVPQSNDNIVEKTENYNTYDDSQNNLSIKTWAWKNTQDKNLNGCYDIGYQLGSNLGQNYTHKNISLYNKSGTYTYYDYNVMTGSMIIITTNKLDVITHIVETMKKSEIKPDIDLEEFTNMALGLSSQNNNTNNTTLAQKTRTTTKKSTKTNSKKSDNTINGEKITERHDFAGNPDYEYLGTENNIYIKEKKTGKVHKRYLDEEEGAYYFK